MYNPVATYRLQFHKGFTFQDLDEVLPYLYELGVKTIYASPIFEATPGSNHGYDVVNPHQINPEIGTLAQLEAISARLKALGIGWLQDIVPNHMAFHPNNNWLMDVLENGHGSAYADYFDILWNVPDFGGKLMVPFLGSPLPELIIAGEIKLTWEPNGLFLQYGEQAYPVNKATYLRLLQVPGDIPEKIKTTRQDDLKNELIASKDLTAVKKYIKHALALTNTDAALLQAIADEQYYRLSYWKDSDQKINYRRFFTVNGLICLNIQREEVFDDYHRFIKELLDRGIFQGLRVDHIDGLFDPAGYLSRLRALAGPETYIVVEKILENGEQFPADWPVEGNTGYDFLAVVNNLLTNKKSKKQFSKFYNHQIQKATPVERSVYEKKAAILYGQMGGELENLYRLFINLELATSAQLKEADPKNIKNAIAEFLIRCPVYRFYGNRFPLGKQELAAIAAMLATINAAKPHLGKAIALLKKIWTRTPAGEKKRNAALHFYQRCMQFSGPLMAKGVEDTLMYTYERFAGHNEVGDSPSAFGITTEDFHHIMAERQEKWPLSLNATSTHDTKRGEDVRAKLNILTDMPGMWFDCVREWQKHNAKFKRDDEPDANDEYLIYQTLAGAAALPDEPQDNLSERLAAYLTKALREGKVNSQWAEPNEAYEQATLAFAGNLLSPRKGILKSLETLQAKVADNFILNSLVQVLLKFTCPGTPDVYQGCELWDLSLVDPDNRRPVDYAVRNQQLETVKGLAKKALFDKRYDGSLKLWLTEKLLHARATDAGLFSAGSYIPLQVKGKYKNNLIAFGRLHMRNWLVVIAPLHLATLTEQPFGFDWEDTFVVLPDDAPLQWTEVFSKKKLTIDSQLAVNKLLNDFPVSVLRSCKANDRSAGIIMHITSLPSRYGIGDVGPRARRFAEFLAAAGQTYWQLLPLSPTSAAADYSPYSSFSSMGGNTLLISPDDLVTEGLLQRDEVERYYLPETATVNFEGTAVLKNKLFTIAYQHFMANASKIEHAAFESFKTKEAVWLHDFALYETLKTQHNGRLWQDWAPRFRDRDKAALVTFATEHTAEIDFSKWLQFVFFRQWNKLKAFGNELGIRFFGDLPFYVSYDSADVWAHPELFSLDKGRHMLGIAGVPPDYFNAGGQLWGMPVYNWEKLVSTGYAWWIDRIKKNREYFDLIRLDHFRAFYDFWEVPAGESSAINGYWKPGPAAAFFNALKDALGELPFIAEDLGDISPGVYTLRDEFGLAGMNVLQYAFGEDMPVSIHVPHNHIIHSVTYTGTHDNNTSLGWFKTEAAAADRRRLSGYLHTTVNQKNVSLLLIETAYASVSSIAIVPLQDVLALDGTARMNVPASKEGNWRWRMLGKQLNPAVLTMLQRLVKTYNR